MDDILKEVCRVYGTPTKKVARRKRKHPTR